MYFFSYQKKKGGVIITLPVNFFLVTTFKKHNIPKRNTSYQTESSFSSRIGKYQQLASEAVQNRYSFRSQMTHHSGGNWCEYYYSTRPNEMRCRPYGLQMPDGINHHQVLLSSTSKLSFERPRIRRELIFLSRIHLILAIKGRLHSHRMQVEYKK